MQIKRLIIGDAEKNGHEIHLKCFFETNLTPFQQNCMKGETHVTTFGGKNSCTNFKCIWKWSGPKLLTPITFNKMGNDSIGI